MLLLFVLLVASLAGFFKLVAIGFEMITWVFAKLLGTSKRSDGSGVQVKDTPDLREIKIEVHVDQEVLDDLTWVANRMPHLFDQRRNSENN